MKLNRNQLKYLVILAMLIDHIAWSFVPTRTVLGQVMHCIGRLTGPTMAFFLAEGYQHTRDVKKYALRLGLFALISWVPYSLYEKEHWPSSEFGVIYTLFLGLMAILIYDKAAIPRWAKNVLILLLCGLSFFGDWSVIDVILPLILFRFRDEPQKKWNLFLLILLITALTDAAMGAMKHGLSGALGNVFQFGLLFVPLLLKYCYDGTSGSRCPFHKWFFYLFYPAHLLILYFLEQALA